MKIKLFLLIIVITVLLFNSNILAGSPECFTINGKKYSLMIVNQFNREQDIFYEIVCKNLNRLLYYADNYYYPQIYYKDGEWRRDEFDYSNEQNYVNDNSIFGLSESLFSDSDSFYTIQLYYTKKKIDIKNWLTNYIPYNLEYFLNRNGEDGNYYRNKYELFTSCNYLPFYTHEYKNGMYGLRYGFFKNYNKAKLFLKESETKGQIFKLNLVYKDFKNYWINADGIRNFGSEE